MARYFDPKEDVIKIELTKYGIQKLKEGNLKPSYYSFNDDEVYYGDESTEIANTKLEKSDHDRIFKDSAYINLYKKSCEKYSSQENYEVEGESYSNHTQPLGNSSKSSSLHSSLSVKFYDKDVTIKSSSLNPIEKYEQKPRTTNNITEIDLGEIEYKISARELRDYQFEDMELDLDDVLGEYSSDFFEDQTFIKIDKPEILFSIVEKNVDDDFENFDIELYEFEGTDADGRYEQIIHPPRYQENIIVDDLLLDGDNEDEIIEFNLKNSNKTTSDIFLIEVDREIPEEVLAELVGAELDSRDDHENENSAPTDIYNNTLSGPFGDDC